MWPELPFPLWQRGLFMARVRKKNRHSAGWLDSAFNVLTVFIHKMSQGDPQQHVHRR